MDSTKPTRCTLVGTGIISMTENIELELIDQKDRADSIIVQECIDFIKSQEEGNNFALLENEGADNASATVQRQEGKASSTSTQDKKKKKNEKPQIMAKPKDSDIDHMMMAPDMLKPKPLDLPDHVLRSHIVFRKGKDGKSNGKISYGMNGSSSAVSVRNNKQKGNKEKKSRDKINVGTDEWIPVTKNPKKAIKEEALQIDQGEDLEWEKALVHEGREKEDNGLDDEILKANDLEETLEINGSLEAEEETKKKDDEVLAKPKRKRKSKKNKRIKNKEGGQTQGGASMTSRLLAMTAILLGLCLFLYKNSILI